MVLLQRPYLAWLLVLPHHVVSPSFISGMAAEVTDAIQAAFTFTKPSSRSSPCPEGYSSLQRPSLNTPLKSTSCTTPFLLTLSYFISNINITHEIIYS